MVDSNCAISYHFTVDIITTWLIFDLNPFSFTKNKRKELDLLKLKKIRTYVNAWVFPRLFKFKFNSQERKFSY